MLPFVVPDAASYEVHVDTKVSSAYFSAEGPAEERIPRPAVPVLPKMSMQVTVEGEDITPEECMQSGAGRRSRHNAEAESAGHALPPAENYRIIVKPRGGLNVKNVSQIKVAHALPSAAQLAPAEIAKDIVCSNVMQNIFFVSTPEENARAYSKVELITVGGANYEVGSYLAAPDNTCKGVVKGVDLDFNEEEITGMIVYPRNPTALEVKRIRNTTTVVVLFDGLKVPNYVVCGPSMLRCTLYRRQKDVCYACGRLGHRADVCLTPENTICRGCGTESPTEDHVCTPECALCGDPHSTADRRRRERQRVKSHVSPIGERAQSRSPSRGRSDTPRSRSKSRSSCRGRSRSRGPPSVSMHEPPTPGPTEWADRVKGPASRLEHENASLRNALEQLRAEMDEMKRAGQGQPVQRPLPPATPAPRRPAKKRALSQPILDEGIDELRAELRGFLSELRNALKALSEAVSAMNARVDSVEYKITITDQLSGSAERTASPSAGSSTARAFQNTPQLASDHGVADDRLIDGRNHGGSR
ncbi:hypothetical protein HPB52_014197 [Rhipicephalus sanguineus]|uniref:CCHC-type domain-containing protein n=1 Tax=Rhipicephalus sanguineus TaxID=34632 RepID=A0A9D4PEP2_RHISA|nr:hypothetical protein HPB52_014197 [Rhipicephalus sanguineus]